MIQVPDFLAHRIKKKVTTLKTIKILEQKLKKINGNFQYKFEVSFIIFSFNFEEYGEYFFKTVFVSLSDVELIFKSFFFKGFIF